MSPTMIKRPNIWLIVSIVLAVALVGVLVANSFKKGAGESEMIVLEADEAANQLLDFINKVYAPQVGLATLQGVSEQNGLYRVELEVMVDGGPAAQTVFTTKDVKLFIPQAIDIQILIDEFNALQQQRQQQAQNTPPPVEPAEGEEEPDETEEGEE